MNTNRFVPPSPALSKEDYFKQAREHIAGPRFYECGICGAYHSFLWDGDCREDSARFHPDELDEAFGASDWAEVPMPGGEDEEN